jgi:hypothetical protein
MDGIFVLFHPSHKCHCEAVCAEAIPYFRDIWRLPRHPKTGVVARNDINFMRCMVEKFILFRHSIVLF